MDQPKQQRVWIDQDIIDHTALYVLQYPVIPTPRSQREQKQTIFFQKTLNYQLPLQIFKVSYCPGARKRDILDRDPYLMTCNAPIKLPRQHANWDQIFREFAFLFIFFAPLNFTDLDNRPKFTNVIAQRIRTYGFCHK